MTPVLKISLILNTCIVILVAFATVLMVFDIRFMPDKHELSGSRLDAFKFFTVDSNILAGLSALVLVVTELLAARGVTGGIPVAAAGFKLAGTSGVTLTILTTVFFLAPRCEHGFFSMFLNANLFFHLIIPVLCIVSLVFFDCDSRLPFAWTFWGVVPMLAYSLWYTARLLAHRDSLAEYDIYSFLGGNLRRAPAAFLLILAVTYLISLGLWGFSAAVTK